MKLRARRRRGTRTQPSEALLALALENLPHAVVVKDADELRYIGFNRAAEDLLGVAREEMLGKNDHDLLPGSEADAVRATDREVLASGGTHDFPAHQISTRHRGTRIVHTKKLAIFDADGNATYLLGISEDITEREHADALLSTAQHQADSANRLKSEFLSRMSHELRTPLNAVLGFAQLLEMDRLSAAQDANLHHITRAGRHLLDLVNQVLEISESETGRLAISLEPIGVVQATADAVALVDSVAEAHGVRISASIADADVFVRADHRRLIQVLVNLLTNAIKYGGDGGMVSLATTTPEPGWLRVTVGDEGPGIEPDLIDRLFTPFDRLGAEQGSIEGTGLGLALVKAFVQAMGGRVKVETTPGHGSRFSVDLVLAEAPRHGLDGPQLRESEPAGASYATGSVLYIEDHVSNVELVERALEHRPNLELLIATNGRDGVARADAELPTLVLLDLNLWDIPGQEVLQLLKANPRTARIPVVVVTADASAGRAQELLALGADRYITKPLDLNHFLATVDSFIAAGATGR